MKTVLLVVDMQNDFCLPSGSLYVPGAEKDVERLSRLIKEKMTVIDKIILTADEHHVMDIALRLIGRTNGESIRLLLQLFHGGRCYRESGFLSEIKMR